MTDAAFFPFEANSAPGDAPPGGVPPVKPAWLRPAAFAAVIAAHGAVAWMLMAAAVQTISPLDSVSMDLIPEGDFFESEEVSAAEDTPPPEMAEEPDLAIPPPMVMSPDAPALPAKKEAVEKVKKQVVERKEVEHDKERREAQARRRMGAPEGRAQGSSMSRAAYAGLLARAIRAHTPGSTSLGSGSATVTFNVTSGGGIAVAGASGSSPGHAALARRILASVHAPPPPGGGFFASQSFNFH
jgi:protein TonB